MKNNQFNQSVICLSVSLLLGTAYGQNSSAYLANPYKLVGLTQQISETYSGKGIKLGVVDSGFMLDHPLMNRDKLHPIILELDDDGEKIVIDPSNYDIDTEKDEQGKEFKVYSMHGGQVTGIINSKALAAYNYPGGIAKESEVYVAQTDFNKTTDDGKALGKKSDEEDESFLIGNGNDAQVQRSLLSLGIQKIAEQKPLAINNSWNEDPAGDFAKDADAKYKQALLAQAPTNELITTLKQTVKNDILIVFAAGNESKKQPGIMAALPHYFPELTSHYISVIAVDKDKNLTPYSNYCGVSRYWCIAAPGDLNVLATAGAEEGKKIPSLQKQSGTSFAAPVVTGSLALLKQRFGYFTPTQLRDTLFTTATDLGEKGVDDKYGWGLVNLTDAVLGPRGLLRDETYRVNQNDLWSNKLETEFALTKAGDAELTLTAKNNRIKTLNVNEGKLVLRDTTSADTVNNSAALSLSDLIVNQHYVSAPNAQLVLLSAQGITANGKSATVNLAGSLSAAESLNEKAQAGDTIARVVTLKNGASYQGGFNQLVKSAVLFNKGLRQDLYFSADGVELKANKAEKITDHNADINGQNGLLVLNVLRDMPIAWKKGLYNDWLQQAIEKQNLQNLHYAIGNGIYAESLTFLSKHFATRLSAAENDLFRYRDLAEKTLNVWLDGNSEKYHSNASQGSRTDFHTHRNGVGIAYKTDNHQLIRANFNYLKTEVDQANAQATIKQFEAGAALRYMPSKEWFVDYAGSLARIDYKQQRSFNGKSLGEGKNKGWLMGAELRGGLFFNPQNWLIEPTFGAQWVRLEMNELNEQGEFSLSSAKFTQNDINLVSGLRVKKAFDGEYGTITPNVALDYLYRLNHSDTKVRSSLQGISFDNQSVAFSRGWAELSGGVTFERNNWFMAAELKRELSANGKGTRWMTKLGLRF
ncbi:S8 family peptidase [Caviibacterium pharyngocola]|uniref:Peptidase S8 n=1 Tax=Caviibacterium pharyngocola TaxID=28159 RepID=A0A2M8RUE0_9PAST|nr:S8 family serine peptidase [Caviibacterium pharyngocola]PJG82516.1 peptidase S8 [Caviibacterium pharyngocola]